MTERGATLSLVVSLMLALSLAACGRNPTPPTTPGNPDDPGTTPQPQEVGGTIEGWPGGEASLKVAGDVIRFFLSEGPISADSSFSLTLPVSGQALEDALFPITTDNFCGTIVVTPEPFKAAPAYFYVYESAVSSSPDPIGRLLLGASAENDPEGFSYVYADRDASIRGECISTTYPDGRLSIYRFNLNYKHGWNTTTSLYSTEGDLDVTKFATKPVPAGAVWSYSSDLLPEPLLESKFLYRKRSPAGPF